MITITFSRIMIIIILMIMIMMMAVMMMMMVFIIMTMMVTTIMIFIIIDRKLRGIGDERAASKRRASHERGHPQVSNFAVVFVLLILGAGPGRL